MEQTIRNFKSLAASIGAVYLVEASPVLRDAQKRLLCGDAPMEEIDMGFRSTSIYSNIPVIWCEDIRFVPDGNETTHHHHHCPLFHLLAD